MPLYQINLRGFRAEATFFKDVFELLVSFVKSLLEIQSHRHGFRDLFLFLTPKKNYVLYTSFLFLNYLVFFCLKDVDILCNAI